MRFGMRALGWTPRPLSPWWGRTAAAPRDSRSLLPAVLLHAPGWPAEVPPALEPRVPSARALSDARGLSDDTVSSVFATGFSSLSMTLSELIRFIDFGL